MAARSESGLCVFFMAQLWQAVLGQLFAERRNFAAFIESLPKCFQLQNKLIDSFLYLF